VAILEGPAAALDELVDARFASLDGRTAPGNAVGPLAEGAWEVRALGRRRSADANGADVMAHDPACWAPEWC
jgi:hypothetical protein